MEAFKRKMRKPEAKSISSRHQLTNSSKQQFDTTKTELPLLSYMDPARAKKLVIFSRVLLFISFSVSMVILLDCKPASAHLEGQTKPLEETRQFGATSSNSSDRWDELVTDILDQSGDFSIWCDSLLARWTYDLAEPTQGLRYRRSAPEEHELVPDVAQQVGNGTEEHRKQLASKSQFYRSRPQVNVTHMALSAPRPTLTSRAEREPLSVGRLGVGFLKDEPALVKKARKARQRQGAYRKASTNEPITLESYDEPTETVLAAAENPLDQTTTEPSLYSESNEDSAGSEPTGEPAGLHRPSTPRSAQLNELSTATPVVVPEASEETAGGQQAPDWANQNAATDESMQQLNAAINNMSDEDIKLLLDSAGETSARKAARNLRSHRPSHQVNPVPFAQHVSAPYSAGLALGAAIGDQQPANQLRLKQHQLSQQRLPAKLLPVDPSSGQQLASLVEEKFYTDMPSTQGAKQKERRVRLPIKSQSSRIKGLAGALVAPSQPLAASSDYLVSQEAPGGSSLQPAVFHSGLDAGQAGLGAGPLPLAGQAQVLGLIRAASVPAGAGLLPLGLAQQATLGQLARRAPLLSGQALVPLRYAANGLASAAAGSTLSHSYMALPGHTPMPLSAYLRPSQLASSRNQINGSQQRNLVSQHRIGRVADTGATNYDDSPSSAASSDPMWSDTQNQQEDYQQSPQTIQITAVPNGVGLNNGFANGWGNGWNGWGPWNGRQVLLVNRQPQGEWRQWLLPLAAILALPLVLGALFVPVFLKSVMFLIQILQMLGLLLPPSQLAGHLGSSAHNSAPG